jgi:antirestriction protein ArdC
MANAKYASTRAGKPYKAQDHYQELTDRVIAALEAGTRPWQKPWDPNKAGGPAMPVNGATGRRYRGINTLVLGMSPLAFTSNDPRWSTYKQAADRGWQIRRCEKGTTVFFFKQLTINDHNSPKNDDDHTRRIPLLRSFTVFHASQIDGIPPIAPTTVQDAPWRRPEAVDVILRNSNAIIRIGGDRAFYSPATDHIQLPMESAFQSPEGWAATALHGLSHHAGASHRLNRDLSGRFGSDSYSREEMVAEFSSLIIGTELGLPTDIPNHASYIESWIKILKNDKREIFRAAAAAQKCADYCLAFHPDYAASMTDTTDSKPQEDERDLAA